MKNFRKDECDMHYKMNVVISDPNTKKGMYSGIPFCLDVYLFNKLSQYGNAYTVDICCNDCYQLSFEARCECDNVDKCLEKWAHNYWSGKNGAWLVKSLEIKKMQ